MFFIVFHQCMFKIIHNVRIYEYVWLPTLITLQYVYYNTAITAISALTLLDERQEEHPTSKTMSDVMPEWLSVWSEVPHSPRLQASNQHNYDGHELS